jgi:hypothetical protein
MPATATTAAPTPDVHSVSPELARYLPESPSRGASDEDATVTIQAGALTKGYAITVETGIREGEWGVEPTKVVRTLYEGANARPIG